MEHLLQHAGAAGGAEGCTSAVNLLVAHCGDGSNVESTSQGEWKIMFDEYLAFFPCMASTTEGCLCADCADRSSFLRRDSAWHQRLDVVPFFVPTTLVQI